MHFIDMGSWSEAYRDETGDFAIARYKNVETDEDWYQAVAHHPERPLGMAIGLSPDNIVVTFGHDLDEIEPSRKRVVVIPEFSQELEDRLAILGKVFNFTTGEFDDPPARVPFDVTRGQALMALHKAGLLTQVRAMVAAHDLEEIRIWFDNATKWQRYNPYLLALAAELDLDDEAVDALFLAASLEG